MKKKIIVSVITTLLSLPLFMVTPLAEPKNVYNTPYGTYTTDYQRVNSDQYGEIQIGPFVIYAVDKNISTFKYQFNNYYTGTVTINTFTNINPTDSLASYKPELFTDDCTVLSYTNSSVTFYIKNVKEFSATLVYPTGNSQFNIQAWANPGTTNITVSQDIQTSVNQILSYVQFINEDSFSIAADVHTIRNKLNDVLGYGSSDDTIETDFDTLISAVNSVGTKIDVLHTDLNSILNENVLMYEQLQALDIYRSLIYELMTENDRYVQYTNRYRIYGDVYLYDHTKNTSSQDWKNSFYIPSGKTYSFIFYTVGSLGSSYNVYSRDSNIVVNVYERQIASAKYIYEFNIKNNASSSNPVAIEFTKDIWFVPIWLGNANLMPIQVQEMIGVNYGDMYTAKMQDVINAINNMSVSVNNMTVNATGITYNTNQTQVTNSVTNYNTNIDYVYSVENNISLQFDNYNQQFNPDFSSSLTALQDTSTMMNGIITQINGIQLFTVPILLTLAGIVLLAILG